MRRIAISLACLGIVVALSGCALGADAGQSASPTATQTPVATPTVDPTLVPTEAPPTVVDVDPIQFADTYGGYIFKIGSGPTWCSIGANSGFAICEQSPLDTKYGSIPIPDDCQYGYGYQVQLLADPATDGSDVAKFTCAGGYYADPVQALTLEDGQRITVGPMSCFVSNVTARCDNQRGNYIVLGPETWAFGN